MNLTMLDKAAALEVERLSQGAPLHQREAAAVALEDAARKLKERAGVYQVTAHSLRDSTEDLPEDEDEPRDLAQSVLQDLAQINVDGYRPTLDTP